MHPTPRTPRIVQFGLLLVLALFAIHVWWLNCVTEDAYITFRYARNLVTHGVIAWNPGEQPVEGYTNFLWMILHAGAYRLGLPLGPFSQWLGAVAGLLTVGLVYRLARRGLGFTPAQALLPCLLLAVCGPMAKGSASGLETSFFTLLIVAGCERFIAYWRFRHFPALVLAQLLLFLATLTRPEGFLVFVLTATLALPFMAVKPRRYLAPLSLAFCVYLLPLLVYFIWRYRYFGFLLPNTFYAKTGGAYYQWLRGLSYSGWFLFCYGLPLLPALLLAAAPHCRGLANSLRRRRQRFWRPLVWLRRRLGITLCLWVSGVYTLYIIYVGGDYMPMFRFFAPLTPFFVLLVSAALNGPRRRDEWSLPCRNVARASVLLVAVLGWALQSTPLETKIFPTPRLHQGTYRGLHMERWSMTRLRLLADFFGARGQNTDSIATDAIGLIGYYSGLKVYDLHGLTDTQIAHLQVKDLGKGLAGHEKHDFEHTFSKRPTFYMYDRFLHPTPPQGLPFPPPLDAFFAQHYRHVHIWLEDPANHESGYLGFYELRR